MVGAPDLAPFKMAMAKLPWGRIGFFQTVIQVFWNERNKEEKSVNIYIKWAIFVIKH